MSRTDNAADRQKVESAFPGLRCNRCEIHRYADGHPSVWISLHGSADDLIRHGLIDQEMIASLPPSGFKRFSQGELRRNKHGYRFSLYEADAEARALLERFGIEPASAPVMTEVEALKTMGDIRESVGMDRADGFKQCNRAVGRQQRLVQWVSCANVIFPNWVELVRARYA